MSFYVIFKIIISIIMVLFVLYLVNSYQKIGESNLACDKRFKRVLQKKDVQHAKLIIIVIIFVLIAITTIIDFFAK